MSVLITGGAGFIGSHVARRFLDRGVETVVLDAFQSLPGLVHDGDFARALSFRANDLLSGARIIRGDIRHRAAVADVLDEVRPRAVIHLAATALVPFAEAHTEEAEDVILTGTANLLRAVRRSDVVERFVYVSSSMVYGSFVAERADESHPTRPTNIYGGLKLAGEDLTRAYLARSSARPVIVRPSGVYGPGDLGGRVVQSFCENALRGRPLVLSGDANDPIDFTWVEDLAEGLRLAAVTSEAADETFNMTFGGACTLGALIDTLREHIPDLQVRTQPTSHQRPRRGTLDISRARRLLGYAPGVDLEQGLGRYLGFLRRLHPEWERRPEPALEKVIPGERRVREVSRLG